MKNTKEEISIFKRDIQMMDLMYKSYAKAQGLSPMSYTVLYYIYDLKENCTQKLICEYTSYPKQSVNLIVTSFLKKGYVRLTEISSDRRNKKIELTDTGYEYAKTILDKSFLAEEKAWHRMSKEQRSVLLEAVKVYIDGLHEELSGG